MDQQAVEIEVPSVEDSVPMWRLIQKAGNLDVNSAYAYMLFCKHFSQTCRVARRDGELVGAATGYLMPDEPESLFVWQVVVDRQARGLGLAGKLLDALIAGSRNRIRRIKTTVSPSNMASRRIFDKLATRLDTTITLSEGFPQSLFPDAHEAEPLLTLGPLNPTN